MGLPVRKSHHDELGKREVYLEDRCKICDEGCEEEAAVPIAPDETIGGRRDGRGEGLVKLQAPVCAHATTVG